MEAGTEDFLDRGQRTFRVEAQDNLPMEVPSSAEFELAPDPGDRPREIRGEVSMRDGKQPVDGLSS